MHPALIILLVVFGTHVVGLIGRERIQAALLPLYLRAFYSADLQAQKRLKKDIFETRQTLNKTSSQDEFAKWAKLRRNVDKMVGQLEGVNGQLVSASSTLSILLRIVLFLATTLFPFVLTFYFGKTPMFFLPPSGTVAARHLGATESPKVAPMGFQLPKHHVHAWDMANETYLGPFGWLLSMTAAPRGSVSAGMWSTVCTRVALLLTAQIKDWIQALTAPKRATASKSTAPGTSESQKASSEKESIPVPGAAEKTSTARRRAAAATSTTAGEKEEL